MNTKEGVCPSNFNWNNWNWNAFRVCLSQISISQLFFLAITISSLYSLYI